MKYLNILRCLLFSRRYINSKIEIGSLIKIGAEQERPLKSAQNPGAISPPHSLKNPGP